MEYVEGVVVVSDIVVVVATKVKCFVVVYEQK
jgi:hypothetical protein